MNIETAKTNALLSLKNKPSKYHVTVLDNSSLPESLKNRDKITFTIKPPTLSTLTEVGLVVQELPSELFDPNNLEMTKEALSHVGAITKIIAVMAHGSSKKEMPDWYIPFLSDNLTVEEVLQLWFEVAQKIKTDFFLPFFRIAKQMNPMMMMDPKDSILGD